MILKKITKYQIITYIFRIIYIVSLLRIIKDTFILDLSAGVPGIVFFLTGMILVYLENKLARLNPKYPDTLCGTLWRLLLSP